MNYPLVVIGGGVAAHSLLFFLQKNNVDSKNILRISSNSALCASSNHTGLVSVAGIAKGISPLGDTLLKACDSFSQWALTFKPAGVMKGHHYILQSQDRHASLESVSQIEGIKLENHSHIRKTQAWFVHSKKYLSWFEKTNASIPSLNDLVCQVEYKNNHWIMETQQGRIIKASVLVLATGAFGKIVEKIFPDCSFEKTSVAAGSFLRFKLQGGIPPYAVDFEEFTLTINQNTAVVGSTTQGVILASDSTALKRYHRKVSSVLGEDFIPPFEQGEIISGIRHKGVKRHPFWGRMGEALFGIHSLYKNGLSFSILAASSLARQLIQTGVFKKNSGKIS